MKRISNYIEIENACNSPFVTTDEIAIIISSSFSKANSFRKELEKELDDEKVKALDLKDENERDKALARCFYFNDTKPHKIPLKRILEKAHIDLDYVRREANKMRKAKLLEKE